MNLQDLAKKAIDEVSTLEPKESKKAVKEQEKAQSELDKKVEFEIGEAKLQEQAPAEAEVIDISAYEAALHKELKPEEQPLPSVQASEETPHCVEISFSDELFLKNIRERILVLFEGLKQSKGDELKARLELTINFLEFLLANIEDKLKK